MTPKAVQLRDRGVLVIPLEIRKSLGIEDGSLLLLEQKDGALVIRPAVAVPIERYTAERQAEFILNDAFDTTSYARAREVVAAMGLNPDKIPHERPGTPTSTSVSGRERPVRRRTQS